MKTLQNKMSAQLMRLITARWISEPIYIATELGIADLLAGGPCTIEEISKKTGTYMQYLYRVLRALTTIGIFVEREKRTFENTPLSECLKSQNMRPVARFFLSEWHNRAWDKLNESVKTGCSAFEAAHEMPAFEWVKQNPGAAQVFHCANQVKINALMRDQCKLTFIFKFSIL